MKKYIFVLVFIAWTLGLCAQNSANWFDGNAYYISSIQNDDVMYFKGISADKEYKFSFGLKPQKNGDYQLVKIKDNDLVPFRAGFGAHVTHEKVGEVDVFQILDDNNNVVWTLKQTSQNHRDALATQLWTKDQPVKKMLESMVLNPYYFSDFSKTELRTIEEYLTNKKKKNNLEVLNLALVNSELNTPDFLRYNVGDIQAIEEAKISSIIYVDNAVSFINAIKSGATIHIKDNTSINLSEALNEYAFFSGADRAWVDDLYEYNGDAKIISESVFNGRQLTVRNLSDITIVGGYNSHIVVNPAYAFVLNFIGCDNIKIQNLTMGHTVEGYCTGGVIGLKACTQSNISYCDLYGCGAYGLVAENCSSIEMYKTTIRDCSYGVMQLFNIQKITIDGCDFFRNKEFSMIEVGSDCKDILLTDCRFAQNNGFLFALRSKVKLENCLIYHADENRLFDNDYLLTKDNATKIIITDMPLGKRAVGPDSEL